MITRVAGTLILPHEVHTAAIGAEVCTQLTLIDIDTCGDVRGQLMAGRALTAVTSLRVYTHTSSAQERISLTLINIHAVLHHHESTFIAFVTLAFKVPWSVHTLASATEVRRYATFVDVCAVPFFRIKRKTTVASAFKASNGVSALAMGTEAGYHLALIDIFEERFPICNFFCGEARSSGTELLVFRGVSHRTLFAFLTTPGRPYGAAAGVHAVTAGNRQCALLIIVPQVAGFQADVKADPSGGIQSHSTGALALE